MQTGELKSGIYRIVNKVNGKFYIGQSRDIRNRWRQHLREDHDTKLYRAFRKYGTDSFTFEVLETCPEDQLNSLEASYIQKLDAIKKGYNSLPGGDSFALPDDVKLKISKSQKKRYKRTPYTAVVKNAITFSTEGVEPLSIKPIVWSGTPVFSMYQFNRILKHMHKDSRTNNRIMSDKWRISGAFSKEVVIKALFHAELA